MITITEFQMSASQFICAQYWYGSVSIVRRFDSPKIQLKLKLALTITLTLTLTDTGGGVLTLTDTGDLRTIVDL